MTSPQAHLPLKPVDFHILLALTSRELHGYGLVKEIEEASDGAVRLEPGNLYRYLRRLEAEGLVEETGRRATPEDPSRRRRYYRVTDPGRAVLAADASRMRRLSLNAERTLAAEG